MTSPPNNVSNVNDIQQLSISYIGEWGDMQGCIVKFHHKETECGPSLKQSPTVLLNYYYYLLECRELQKIYRAHKNEKL